MCYLSTKADLNNVLIEESNHDDYTMPPRFYLKQWKSDYFVTKLFPVDSLAERIRNSPPQLIPNYVAFNQPDNIGQRILNLKKIFPDMKPDISVSV